MVMMQQTNRRRSSLFGQTWAGRGHGFTLIELLVVIAIIAILAAILLTVFSQVREKARQNDCMSKIRQIGMAAVQYVQDYDETFPGGPGVGGLYYPGPEGSWDYLPTIWGNIAPTNVAGRLFPYIRNVQIFVDPNDPTGDRFAAGRWNSRFTRLSFWWHWGLSQGSTLTWPTPGGRPTHNLPGRPHTLASVDKPTLIQMVQDNWAAYHSPPGGPFRWNISFADGHTKFSKWMDYGCPGDWVWMTGPWFRNLWDPREGWNVEGPCLRFEGGRWVQ
jgi:prepilin-type N-terminal cleavage/methylation domain-containing protein